MKNRTDKIRNRIDFQQGKRKEYDKHFYTKNWEITKSTCKSVPVDFIQEFQSF